MSEATALAEIKKIAGIADLSKMTQGDAERLVTLIGQQRLNEAQVQLLLKVTPQFTAMAQAAIKMQLEIVNGVSASQSEAFQTLKSIVEGTNKSLELLSKRANTDEARMHIANCIVEMARIFASAPQKMNADNNKTWKVVATTIALIVLPALSALGGAYAASRSNKPDV
jgi:hypothetical protein